MKASWLIGCALLGLSLATASQERAGSSGTEMVATLRALVAYCSLEAQGSRLEQSERDREEQINRHFKRADACVKERMAAGEDAYKATRARTPEDRDLLRPIYARWLTWLDSYRNPYDENAHQRGRESFDNAANELIADLLITE